MAELGAATIWGVCAVALAADTATIQAQAAVFMVASIGMLLGGVPKCRNPAKKVEILAHLV